MDIGELEANLALYKAQLQHLDDVTQGSSATQAEDMRVLREELTELISMTEAALLTSKKNELLALLQSTSSPSGELPSTSNGVGASNGAEGTTNETEVEESEQNESSDSLFNELVGTHCSAVFRTSNGAARRLNAVVLAVDADTQQCWLFCCTPTEPRLVPCRYFLADRCSFDDKACRYSHGYAAPLDDLAEYVEPDFSLLRSGLRCLAKRPEAVDSFPDSELWTEGTVERVDSGSLTCLVRLGNACETVPFASVFPLVEYVVELSDSDSDDVLEVDSKGQPIRKKKRKETIEISDDDDDEVRLIGVTSNATVKKNEESQDSVLTSAGFASWERYTNGIGSRLLRKMGYQYGAGLGVGGSGRVEPVPIEVLPNGRSLDEIMQLKHAANDRQLFNVSNTFGCDAEDGARLHSALRRIHKLNFGPSYSTGGHSRRQLRRKPKPVTGDDKEDSVFAFINRRIHRTEGVNSASQTKAATQYSEKQLRNRSDRELNVEAFQFERQLRELDLQIAKQEAVVARQLVSCSFQTCQSREKLDKLRVQREHLRTAIRRVENHRDTRKHAKFAAF